MNRNHVKGKPGFDEYGYHFVEWLISAAGCASLAVLSAVCVMATGNVMPYALSAIVGCVGACYGFTRSWQAKHWSEYEPPPTETSDDDD